MKNKYISIIIPCYNVEKTLERCINSILNQTFKNFEIILVDDCSTDNTWSVIEKFSNDYDNITGIKNKNNSGAGYSRNVALSMAKYEYISFIDSDDYVEDNFYESMLKQLLKEKSDLVVCDIFVKYDSVIGNDYRCPACADSKNKYYFIDNGLAASPCNKIFRKKDLLEYPFPEGIMNEDIATVVAIMMKSKKISYCEDTYYNYIQYATSVQNSSLSEKRLDIFKSICILEERVPNTSKTKKFWDAIIFNQILMFLIYVIPKERNLFKRRRFLKKFNILSKKYKLRKNRLWWGAFLPNQGKKHRLYYKTFMKLNCNGFYFLSSLLIQFYNFKSDNKKSVIADDITLDSIIELAKKQQKMEQSDIKVSVVIPNYNYEEFLLQRLYSILYQKFKIYEIIILDDCSKDNSRELIDKIENSIKEYVTIRKYYNSENSGSAFKQWEKGFNFAKGNYVWIAEADDYCSNKFLIKAIKPIKKDRNIVISYVDTAFIDKSGHIVLKTIKPEIDILKTGHWNSNYINNGIDEIKDYSYLNCTIANVSSVIFKNDDYKDLFLESGKFRQAGDWLFYVNVMEKGNVSFINKPINYYRLHGNNVTSTTKKQKHFDEIVKIHKYLDDKFRLNKKQKKNIADRYKFLKRVWRLDEKK